MRLRPATRLIQGQDTSDGAGVRLKRSLGSAQLDRLDPFLLLDEFKSDDSTDYIAGFPDHPHRGFETVTYMLAGRMRHKDHVGNQGDLGPGSVQWMTAGKGIIHSETPQQEEGLLWGFQLWVNLPADLKMSQPRYQDIPPEDIPQVQSADGTRIRVIAGESNGVAGPVSGIATSTLYLDVGLDARSRFTEQVQAGHNAFCYVFEGTARVGVSDDRAGQAAGSGSLVVLGDGDAVTVETDETPARFLLLAAGPLGEPVARHGPFVMNTEDEIRHALSDLRTGTFLGA